MFIPLIKLRKWTYEDNKFPWVFQNLWAKKNVHGLFLEITIIQFHDFSRFFIFPNRVKCFPLKAQRPTWSALPWGHCFSDTLLDSPPLTPTSTAPPSRSPGTHRRAESHSQSKEGVVCCVSSRTLRYKPDNVSARRSPEPRLRVLPPPRRGARSGRRRRGCWSAVWGLWRFGKSGRRSDARSCTEPSVKPRRSADAPGGSL